MKESFYQSKYEELFKEYREYAYVISHDLNSPVRHIREFTRLLFEEIEANESTLEYKKFILSSVSQLEDKLDALLKFSRINDAHFHPMDINSKEVIESAVIQVKEKYNISVSYEGSFPEMNIDIVSFEQLFIHVIDNAAKFHKSQNDSQVLVKCEALEKFIEFTVIDDGIGIPANKTEEVFTIFRRLSHEVEGRGMGLTLARKIVSRYDGKIFINKQDSSGTTVKIRIPKNFYSKDKV